MGGCRVLERMAFTVYCSLWKPMSKTTCNDIFVNWVLKCRFTTYLLTRNVVFSPATWNSLPPSLQAPELSLSTFKHLLKTQLFQHAWTIVRRRCDWTASSAPHTNIRTQLNSTQCDCVRCVQIHEMSVMPQQTAAHQVRPGTEVEPARRSAVSQDQRDACTLPAGHSALKASDIIWWRVTLTSRPVVSVTGVAMQGSGTCFQLQSSWPWVCPDLREGRKEALRQVWKKMRQLLLHVNLQTA